MLSCDKTQELLALWAGKDLPDESLREVEEHLAGCNRCRQAAAAWRSDLSRVTAIYKEAPGPELDPRLVNGAIGTALAAGKRPAIRRIWPIAGPLAAVLALFLIWQSIQIGHFSKEDHAEARKSGISWVELQAVFDGCLEEPVEPDSWQVDEGAGLIAVLSRHPSGRGYILADCIESSNLARVSHFPWLKQRLDRYRRTDVGEQGILLAVCSTGKMKRPERLILQKNTLIRFVGRI